MARQAGWCHASIYRMVLRRDSRAATTHLKADFDEAVRGEQEHIDQLHPADWDYYENVVAKNPPNGEVTIPNKVTGDPVRIDLLIATPDEIVNRCGISDHLREHSLEPYRRFLKARLPYWDQGLIPDSIPLLDEGIP